MTMYTLTLPSSVPPEERKDLFELISKLVFMPIATTFNQHNTLKFMYDGCEPIDEFLRAVHVPDGYHILEDT